MGNLKGGMGHIEYTKHRINIEQQEKSHAMSVNDSLVSLLEDVSGIMASQNKQIEQLEKTVNKVIDNQNNLIEAHFNLSKSFIDYLGLKTMF